MLIIFDLDDTLIDTSGCLTHYLLENALTSMQHEGLVIEDFAQALTQLRLLNANSLSAAEALAQFIALHQGTAAMLGRGLKEMYEVDEVTHPLQPLEGAIELLNQLQQEHVLCLVTIGKPQLQFNKLKKAGIDFSIFSKILVSQEENKGALYQALADEFNSGREDIVVCGDRIRRDLSPAKQMGCYTVLMQWGRGCQAELPHPDVDRAISSLKELKNIINEIAHGNNN